MQDKLTALKYYFRSPFLDIGNEKESILLIGMGRSGTTWVANVINYDKSYRILFEPFFPALVHTANQFEYIQYMNPSDNNWNLLQKARQILSGKTRSQWVDQENDGLLYRRRIIKDIRCNLMAGWLKNTVAPSLPIILLIRHPLQVASSWRKLGWGVESLGQRSDYEIIISQQGLLKDFPQIKTIAKQINPKNFLDNVIFLWGVFHIVPFQQLRNKNVYYLFYEQILTDAENECRKLFTYLNKPFSWSTIKPSIFRESSTNYQHRSLSQDKNLLLNGWKLEFSEAEIERTNEILIMFGLDTVYDADGRPTQKNNFIFNTTAV